MGRKVTSVLVENMDCCLYCGKPYPQIHHVFGAANRKLSDRMGFVVPLCEEHHTGTHGVHNDFSKNIQLKQVAQAFFEQNGTREEFRSLFGKSYL